MKPFLAPCRSPHPDRMRLRSHYRDLPGRRGHRHHRRSRDLVLERRGRLRLRPVSPRQPDLQPRPYGIYAGGTSAIPATADGNAFCMGGTLCHSDHLNGQSDRQHDRCGERLPGGSGPARRRWHRRHPRVRPGLSGPAARPSRPRSRTASVAGWAVGPRPHRCRTRPQIAWTSHSTQGPIEGRFRVRSPGRPGLRRPLQCSPNEDPQRHAAQTIKQRSMTSSSRSACRSARVVRGELRPTDVLPETVDPRSEEESACMSKPTTRHVSVA